MKHCPECNKNYADPTLSFCLQDGAPLIYGEAINEPATAILSGDRSRNEPADNVDARKTAMATEAFAIPVSESFVDSPPYFDLSMTISRIRLIASRRVMRGPVVFTFQLFITTTMSYSGNAIGI